MWRFLLLLAYCSCYEIYIVPHSHCDPGWLKTVQEYYRDDVKHILNNIVSILQKDVRRKIVWSETVFLKMWMSEQSEETKNSFKNLINNGQIEIVGGGYVQNDEANPDFEMIIRQIETGHQYLKENFNITRVKVAWQIDPFGHSALTPTILAKFGYENLVTSRMNINFRNQLIKEGNLEFIWEGVNFGDHESIFVHNLYEHYDFPEMFNQWKSECFSSSSVFADNLNKCADRLRSMIEERQLAYKHDKIMILYGDDFYYSRQPEAGLKFEHMEALRDHMAKTSKYQDLVIKIATPSEYFEAIKNTEFSVYKGDLFQYVNLRPSGGGVSWTGHLDHAIWTGFYTTRPLLKQNIYYAQKIVRAAEIAQAISLQKQFTSLDVSLMLHHDAITGTCRPQVYEDYRSRLEEVVKTSIKAINEAIKSKFPISEAKFTLALPYKVTIVYNPLNWENMKLLSFTVKKGIFLEIKNWKGENIPSQSINNLLDNEQKTVYIKIELPPLSFATLFINEHTERCEKCDKESEILENERKISDKSFTVFFNDFGMVEKISKLNSTYDLRQTFWTYSGINAGAYLYSPNGNGNNITDLSLDKISVTKGPLFEMVEVLWRRTKKHFDIDFYYQRIILYGGKRFTMEYGLYAYTNEEILVRFSSNDITWEKWLLTSSSGDLRERRFYPAAPKGKGANMYPIPGGFAVDLGNNFLQVFPKFSVGVGMADKNTFELLLHRNLERDDNFGLSMGVDDNSFVNYHFEIDISQLTHKNFRTNYLEARTDVYMFPLINLHDFTISDQRAVEINENWNRETLYLLGFNHSNIYLSSAVVKENNLFMRVLNLKDAAQKLSVSGFRFHDKTLFNGFLKYRSYKYTLIDKNELVFYEKSDTGKPKYLPPSDKNSLGRVILEPFELSTFKVEIAPNEIAEEEKEEKSLVYDIEFPKFLESINIEEQSPEGTDWLIYIIVVISSLIFVVGIVLHFKLNKSRSITNTN